MNEVSEVQLDSSPPSPYTLQSSILDLVLEIWPNSTLEFSNIVNCFHVYSLLFTCLQIFTFYNVYCCNVS